MRPYIFAFLLLVVVINRNAQDTLPKHNSSSSPSNNKDRIASARLLLKQHIPLGPSVALGDPLTGASSQPAQLFSNWNQLINKISDHIYYDGAKSYGTYDSTKDVSRFTFLGLSFCLFLFSIYLFYVSNKLYKLYNYDENEKAFNHVFIFIIAFLNIFGAIAIVVSKGLPVTFLGDEIFLYPNQFLLGIVLSSLLLLSVGIFRFSIIAIVPGANKSKKRANDSQLSRVAGFFAILSALADIATIWRVLRP